MALSKVVNNSIESVDAAKLSGTIADARFPATLPAISGANLTGIDALPAVGSSGNVLTSDGTNWASTAAAAGGKILSFFHTVKTDTFTTSTTGSWVDVTGLSVTTGALASTGSKVLVQVTMNVGCPGDYSSARVVDGSGNIITGFVGDAASSRTRGSLGTFYRGADGGTVTQVNLTTNLYDSPNSTSAQTYKVQTWSGAAIYVNRSSGDSDAAAHTRSVSIISAMEISA